MPVPWWLPDIALGILGAGGEMLTNRSNAKMAREQMRFQERMSSTAAQRAVKDYTLAGLNPALAYERPASSPGGASALMGNPVEAGINTAQQARQVKAQLELLGEQTEKTRQERRTAEVEQRVATNTEEERTKTELQRLRFERQLQPYQLRASHLANTLTAAQVPGAQAQARYDAMLGAARPALRDVLSVAPMLVGTAGAAALVSRGIRAGGSATAAQAARASADRGAGFARRPVDVRSPRPLNPRRPGGWQPNSP